MYQWHAAIDLPIPDFRGIRITLNKPDPHTLT